MSPVALQVEADQAPLSQDVAWQRSTRSARFLWTGLGFALLMLIGLLGEHQRTLPAAVADRQDGAVLQTMMAMQHVDPLHEKVNGILYTGSDKVAGVFADARDWVKQGLDDRDCRVRGRCTGGICIADECIGSGMQREAKRLADQAKRSGKNIQAEAKRIAKQAEKDGLAKAKRVAYQAKQHALDEANRIAEKTYKDGLAEAKRMADKADKQADKLQAEAKRIADQAKKDALAKATRFADGERP